MALQTVLITGANSGVGFAICQALFHAPEGYNILLTGRNSAAVKEAAATIEASGSSKSHVTPVHLDVADSKSITAAASLISSQFEALDCLINNAAIGGLSFPRDDSIASVEQRMTAILSINVTGAALVSAAFRPLLMKSSNPRSIYVSSGAGRFSWIKPLEPGGMPGGGAYSVSKAALNMLAVMEYKAYGSQGLKVFATTPGFVISNLRGKDEDARSGWGKAEPADSSGKFYLDMVRGEWDEQGVGRFVSKDNGVVDW